MTIGLLIYHHITITFSIFLKKTLFYLVGNRITRLHTLEEIKVQVESVKRRKMEGFGRKRKNKENWDPQTIPSRKLVKRDII